MRIASIILASVPFVVAVGFLVAMSMSTGPEGLGVFIAGLYTCIALAALSIAAVVLAFVKRPVSGVDIPARVISIVSLVAFLPAGGFGLILFVMMLFPPAVNA